jgi:hypothetical protein
MRRRGQTQTGQGMQVQSSANAIPTAPRAMREAALTGTVAAPPVASFSQRSERAATPPNAAPSWAADADAGFAAPGEWIGDRLAWHLEQADREEGELTPEPVRREDEEQHGRRQE